MSTNTDNQKRILKNSLFLYVRMLFVMIVTLFSVRIVLRNLEIVDYGIYTAIGGLVLSLSFLSNVLSSASQRFFSYELGLGNYERLSKIFNTIFLSYLIIVSLIVLLAETLGLWFLRTKMSIPDDRMDAAYWVFQFSLFSFVVSILTNPYMALLIAHENMNVYAYVGILDVILKLFVACVLMWVTVDKLKLYSLLMFVVSCVTGLVYVCICRRRFRKMRLELLWDKSLFKSVFSYSSWTLFGTAAGVLNNQGVNVLLNVFFGPVVNSAYAVGHQVGNAVSSFSSSFYTAVRPQLTKSYAAKDTVYMNQLFYFSSKTIFSLLFLIVLPLTLEAEFILHLWLGTVREYMVIFVRLILVSTMLISLSNPITTIAQASGHVKNYHGIVDGFTLMTMPLSYIVLKIGYPPVSVFYVSIGVFAIAHILRLVVLKRIVEFSYRKYLVQFVIPAIVIVIVSTAISGYIQSLFTNNVWRFISVGAVSTISTFIGSFFFLFDEEEKGIIRSFVRH